MAAVTVRNLPDEVHRALKLRAAAHNRSTEAEIRAILEDSVRPADRLRLGTLIWQSAREAGVTEADVDALEAAIDGIRSKQPAEPMRFE